MRLNVIAESMQRNSEFEDCYTCMPPAVFALPSKVQELERELNMFKAKFVSLLSDKFKFVVLSKF